MVSEIKEYISDISFQSLLQAKKQGQLGRKQLTKPLWLKKWQAKELGFNEGEDDFLLEAAEPEEGALFGRIKQPEVPEVPEFPQEIEESPITGLLRKVYPSFGMPETDFLNDIDKRAREDPDKFLEDLRLRGPSEDTIQVLQMFSSEPLTEEDIDSFFQGQPEITPEQNLMMKALPLLVNARTLDWATKYFGDSPDKLRRELITAGRNPDTEAFVKSLYPQITERGLKDYFSPRMPKMEEFPIVSGGKAIRTLPVTFLDDPALWWRQYREKSQAQQESEQKSIAMSRERFGQISGITGWANTPTALGGLTPAEIVGLGLIAYATVEAGKIGWDIFLRSSLLRNLNSWAKSAGIEIPDETKNTFINNAMANLSKKYLSQQALKTIFKPTKAGFQASPQMASQAESEVLALIQREAASLVPRATQTGALAFGGATKEPIPPTILNIAAKIAKQVQLTPEEEQFRVNNREAVETALRVNAPILEAKPPTPTKGAVVAPEKVTPAPEVTKEPWQMTLAEEAEIKNLEGQLRKAVAHSKEAVAIGQKIRAIDQAVYLRRQATITPEADRAMKALGRRLGISPQPVVPKAEVTPVTPSNPYMNMPIERVRRDAEYGVKLAKEALAVREAVVTPEKVTPAPEVTIPDITRKGIPVGEGLDQTMARQLADGSFQVTPSYNLVNKGFERKIFKTQQEAKAYINELQRTTPARKLEVGSTAELGIEQGKPFTDDFGHTWVMGKEAGTNQFKLDTVVQGQRISVWARKESGWQANRADALDKLRQMEAIPKAEAVPEAVSRQRAFAIATAQARKEGFTSFRKGTEGAIRRDEIAEAILRKAPEAPAVAEAIIGEVAPAGAEVPPAPPSKDIPLNTTPEPTNPTPTQSNIIGLRRIEPGLTKTEIAGNFLKGMTNALGRATGLGQLVEAEPVANAAMRERARVLVTVESQANLLGTKWATDLQKVFTFNKKGQISSLTGIDPDVPGAPTIQDVAARLPNYRDSLSSEQLKVIEGLREAIAPYRQLLEEQGIEIPLRPDVMAGGFYLPRGRAALEGVEEPFKIGGRGRGVKKGFERPAFFDSMAQGINAGFEYSDIRQVLTSYTYDAGVRSTNTYIANYFKTLNDETGRLIGETVKMRMLRQNPEIAAVVEDVKKNLNGLKRNIGALTQRQMDIIEMWQNDHEFGDIDVLLDGLETMRGGIPAETLPALKALYQSNLDTLKELRPSYKVAMRRAQATPREQGVIILPELAGRTYPNEIANAVNAVLKTEGETIGRLSPVLNVINAYNNLYRGIRATLDDSIVGIQGLLGMYGDPKAYAAAFKLHLGAWANDRVLGAWVKDFDASRKAAGRLTTGEMATHGLHFAGAEGTEFSLGVGTKIGELPGVKQANRAFSNFGDVIRTTWADHSVETELAKGRTLEQLRESGDLDRIMNISNAMTGWTTKKTFGSLGELVLFAPRFLQARLETVTKAALGLRPGAALDQRIARNSIIKMIVIGILLTMAANAVQGEDTDFELLRKDKEGRWRRNAKFMRIKFGGQYYSLFGTWDSLLGVFVNIATGRPLQVVRSMASGLVSNAFDIITGRDYNYKATTDSPSHFAQWALSNIVPFAVSQAGIGAKQVWGGIIDGEASDIVEGAIVIGTALFGYKSFPQEDWDANLKRLGLWLYGEDTLLSTENVRYTWRLFVNDTSDSSSFKSVPLEKIVSSSDYPPQVQAVAKTLLLMDEYSAVPNWTLISINADPDKGATFIDFYDQWADRQKLVEAGDKASYTVKGELQPDGKRKDVTYKGEDAIKAYDKMFPDAKFGQMSQGEFVLLKEYWSLNSDKLKAEMVEKHLELKANKREEKLKSNPTDNAYLALAGYESPLTKAAYDEFKRLLKELDIPDTAIPVSEIWGKKVTTLPSDALVNANFERGDIVDEFGANSWEDKLHRAKNPELNTWLGLGEIDTPIASLELKTEKIYRGVWGKLNKEDDPDWVGNLDDKEKVDGLTARDRKIAELKANKIGDMTWIDIDRKITAIEKGTDEAPVDEKLVNAYVERGRLIDQPGLGSGSAEVMLQRIDNPDFDKWLTDKDIWGDNALKPIDTSKIPIWRIDVKYRKEDAEYQAILDKYEGREETQKTDEYMATHEVYRKDDRRREAYGLTNSQTGERFPLDQIESYVGYMEILDKPGVGSSSAETMLYRVDNPAFNDAMLRIKEWQPIDESKIREWRIEVEFKDLFDERQNILDRTDDITEQNAKIQQLFAENPAFQSAYYRHAGYKLDLSEEHTENYVTYMLMPEKGWSKERYLKLHPGFFEQIRKIKGWETDIKWDEVPSEKIENLYFQYLDLTEGKRRQDFRFENPELDDWLVLTGKVTRSIKEQKRRGELTPREKALEDIAAQQSEFEKKIAELRKKLGGL